MTFELDPELKAAIASDQHETIVGHNVAMLQSEAFRRTFMTESFGGNAGSAVIDEVEVACVAVNGFANPDTGEIRAFEMPESADGESGNAAGRFVLKVAVIMGTTDFTTHNRIVELDASELPALAEVRLSRTITAYNELEASGPRGRVAVQP